MIEINYMHSMADHPDIYLKNYTDDGIGMYNEPKGPVTAEFLGLVKYEGQDYLIGRTTQAFKNDPDCEGKITVRHAMFNKTEQDIDKDIFIDMEEDEYTKKLEEKLTDLDKNEKITNVSIRHMADDLDLELLPYGRTMHDGTINAISIKHQAYVYIEMCRKEEDISQENEVIKY